MLLLLKIILMIDWNQKLFFSGRFLNFFSNHPISQKRGIMFGLLDKALLLSDSAFHEKNIIFTINNLIENDYPFKFIFDTINNRIKNIFNRRISRKDKVVNDVDLTVKPSWLTYVTI